MLSFFKLEKIKYRTLYRVPASYVLGSASQVNDRVDSTWICHSMFDNWKHSILFVKLLFLRENSFFRKFYHIMWSLKTTWTICLRYAWKRVSFLWIIILFVHLCCSFETFCWTSCYVDLKIKNVSRRFLPESYWICADHKNYQNHSPGHFIESAHTDHVNLGI